MRTPTEDSGLSPRNSCSFLRAPSVTLIVRVCSILMDPEGVEACSVWGMVRFESALLLEASEQGRTAGSRPPYPGPTHPPAVRRLLLVDDEPDILETVAEL